MAGWARLDALASRPRWRPGRAGVCTTVSYDSVADVLALHSHPDETGQVRSTLWWLDERQPSVPTEPLGQRLTLVSGQAA
ncbi:MAG TPA: hypothetical protein VGW38_19545 [Chloroflexota bacterium]|nr:hypothetical protein [Chloroflexota bacterium]